MNNYTVSEFAKKVKVSSNHIYNLIKSGQISKANSLGRAIRIPSSELKRMANLPVLQYSPEKVEMIKTHLGSVRKVKNEDWYLIGDICKCILIAGANTIKKCKVVKENHVKKLNMENAKMLGIPSRNTGTLFISLKGIEEYSTVSKAAIDWARLLDELKPLDKPKIEQQSFEEQITQQVKSTIDNSQLQIFNSSEFGQVRVLEENSQPWFIGKEIAECLGYKDAKDAVKTHVSIEDKKIIQKGQNTLLKFLIGG